MPWGNEVMRWSSLVGINVVVAVHWESESPWTDKVVVAVVVG